MVHNFGTKPSVFYQFLVYFKDIRKQNPNYQETSTIAVDSLMQYQSPVNIWGPVLRKSSSKSYTCVMG